MNSSLIFLEFLGLKRYGWPRKWADHSLAAGGSFVERSYLAWAPWLPLGPHTPAQPVA